MIGRALAKLSGAALLIIPFIPIATIFGPFPDEQGLFTPAEWALGGAIVATLAAIIPPQIPDAVERGFARLMNLRSLPLLLMGLLGFASVLSTSLLFKRSPLLIDEAAQFFQGKIIAGGALTAQMPKLPEFFFMQQMLFDGERLYAQYPPGHSVALALGTTLGVPWMIGPALTILTGMFLYQFCSEIYGEVTARRTLLAAALCPFLIFLGSSYMNHISALCGLSLALWSAARWERTGAKSALAAAGAGIGFALLSRPLCAAAGASVIFCWIASQIFSRRAFGAALAGAAAAFGAILLFAFYNSQTTGDPLLPGYLKLWGSSHGLGFHRTPWGGEHTPIAGIKNLLINVSMLNEFLFETPIPGLISIACLGLLSSRDDNRTTPERRWDRRLLALFWAFPIIYLFYWHRDSYLGPRFISGSVLAALPLTVRGLEVLLRAAGERKIVSYALRPRLLSAVTLAVLSMLFLGLPSRFMIYRSQNASMKEAQQMAHKLGTAEQRLIFVPVSWGSRIISILRAHGASASVMEEAYYSADHCQLQELADRALNGEVPAGEIDRELRTLQAARAPRAKVSADPTVRLLPGRALTSACLTELERDKRGFTLSLPYLVLNDPQFRGPLIFATDLGERNRLLAEQYPQHTAAILGRGGLEPLNPSH